MMPDAVDPAGPVEPLAESAPLAWAIAPRLCPGDPQSPHACVWYHRVWQYLRLLGVNTSIRTNSAFLTRTFDGLALNNPRVLVSGSADYAMLAHLRHAYGGRPLDVTVLDLCPTALYLNEWYAGRSGFRVSTVQCDALEHMTNRPYDLVCTHNFVGRFDPATRRRLVARWAMLLRPDGVVVTTQRIRPNHPGQKNAYTADGAGELRARVVAAATAYPASLDADIDEIGAAAYQYALRQGGYVIRTTREITDAFEAEGFDIELVDEGGGMPERERDRPASSDRMDTFRMRVVARKRERS
jgi:SAM-dependent methyltransferase